MASRILHVFPSFEIGGAQARFAQIAGHFGARFDHCVFALDGRADARNLVPAGVPLRIVTPDFDKRRQLANIWTFRGILATTPHDLLLTYNWGAVDWALANRLGRRIRHIHMEDGFGPEEADRQLPRRVWYRRIALTGGHTIVVVPSQTLRRIATETWRLSARRVRYIANGIDCARFAPATPASPVATGPVTIGTVATLRAEKNLGRLLDAVAAARRQSPLRLIVVGDGPERAALEAQAARLALGDSVVFAGATSTPETFYRQMDVFALSSDTEQMPYSVLEAMACGLPVVATDVGDIRAMVATANLPFIVSTRTPDAIAAALLALARDRELRLRVASANREAALDRFDVNAMFGRYLALFEGREPDLR
ncbi:MAG: glycosyltransferase family 4 protein [Alphaproteobacteria bacterium]|nr:glycosyltransferase family 4 protein [Alphaproteobacteria bacterium]